MKKIFLLLSSAIIVATLTACGGGNSDSSATEQNTSVSQTDKVSKIIVEWTPDINFLPTPTSKVIKTQDELNETIGELEVAKDSDSDTVESWISSLQNSDIDFEKENLITYAFLYGCIPEYKVDTALATDTQANIIMTKTREECDSAEILFYLAYKVSKDIETVQIIPFNQETVTINMTQP